MINPLEEKKLAVCIRVTYYGEPFRDEGFSRRGGGYRFSCFSQLKYGGGLNDIPGMVEKKRNFGQDMAHIWLKSLNISVMG